MPTPSPHSHSDNGSTEPAPPLGAALEPLPETPVLYASHARFVWRCLVRFGVPASDREDLLQEVFVVVHRRRADYEPRGQVTSWLFGIAQRVASRSLRRVRARQETVAAEHTASEGRGTPENSAIARQRAHLLERILSELPLKQRVVFVMFEIEGTSCDAIAQELGVPVGTVYSRLHAARAHVRQAWSLLEPQSPASQCSEAQSPKAQP